jgi:hypothetical protein
MVSNLAQWLYEKTIQLDDGGMLTYGEYDAFKNEWDIEAEELLTLLEKAGMRPPRLDEDKVQALMSVYYARYTTYQWDEDFEKDADAVNALNRRS